MNYKVPASRPAYHPVSRQVEGEGILRMVLLAFTIALPAASMIFLKTQQIRLSYEMADVKAKINQEEEQRRMLLLERSRYQRDEEVQAYAEGAGLLPRKQSHLIQRTFSVEDQRLARLQGTPGAGM